MRLVVFGGTGGTGKHLIARALADGHDVVAVARRPDAIPAGERLTVHKGDVLDKASFLPALSGAEAVLSAIGPASMWSPGTLLTEGVANLVSACTEAGVKRFVYESGLIGGDGDGLSTVHRWLLAATKTVFFRLSAEKVAAEATVRGSALDWVIVRPPGLDQSPPTGKYLVGPAAPVQVTRTLSHADVADFMVKASSDSTVVRQTVNIGH